MSDDLLSQFTSALAEEHDGATAVPEATRARVIRALAEKRRRGRKWWAVGIPAFAIFGGSTAWAAATGRIPLPAVVEKAVAVFIETPEPVLEKKPTKRSGASRSLTKPPELAPAPEEEAEEIESPEERPEATAEEAPEASAGKNKPPASVAAAPPAQPSIAPKPTPQTDAPQAPKNSKPTPAAPVDQALLTYRSAHRAQFQNGNCSEAIAGYERYLQEDPSGSFALEAGYNRGVCLAKMGRKASAIQALRPFADGKYGTYRQEKSRALIEALGQ